MTNLDQMNRTIGGLEAVVKALGEQWRQQEASAVEGRKALYKRFEDLASDLHLITVKLDTLLAEHDEKVMPTIDAYRIASAQRVGFLFAGRLVWAFTIGVFTVLGFVLHELISYLRGH